MSEMQAPRFENKFSFGNLFTLVSGVVAVGVIVGAAQTDVKALAQRMDASDKRVEAGERRDDKTAETLDAVKGAIIELRGDQRSMKNEVERQGKLLDRIEQLLRDGNKVLPK